MRPYAKRLANSLRNRKGVRTIVVGGYIMHATSDGKNVVVKVVSPPRLVGSISSEFYHKPIEGKPVVWTTSVNQEGWPYQAEEGSEEPNPDLTVKRPGNSFSAGYLAWQSTGLLVTGAVPAGLASSVFAGAFIKVSSYTSYIAAFRCTGAMASGSAYTGLNNHQHMISHSSGIKNPASAGLIAISWPFMDGFGQGAIAAGVEWGASSGILVGSAFNNEPFGGDHAACFRYKLNKAEGSSYYSVVVQHQKDWADSSLLGVAWAKNAGFKVSDEDLETDPSAADAMFILHRRSNHRQVSTAYFIASSEDTTPCPQSPEGHWDAGPICSAITRFKGNMWVWPNAYHRWPEESYYLPAYDHETVLVVSHADGSTDEIELSNGTTDPTDITRSNETSYRAVFGVSTVDGKPRLLCRAYTPEFIMTPPDPGEVGFIDRPMYQKQCYESTNGTVEEEMGSGVMIQAVFREPTKGKVTVKQFTPGEAFNATKWVLVGPGGEKVELGLGGSAPVSYIQGEGKMLPYCAYAPGLFAVVVATQGALIDGGIEGGEYDSDYLPISIKVFSASTGAQVASSGTLMSVSRSDMVFLTCAKAGKVDPDSGAITEHATLFLTATSKVDRYTQGVPTSAQLYAIENLGAPRVVASAPPGSAVFDFGSPLESVRAGAVPRYVPPQPPA